MPISEGYVTAKAEIPLEVSAELSKLATLTPLTKANLIAVAITIGAQKICHDDFKKSDVVRIAKELGVYFTPAIE